LNFKEILELIDKVAESGIGSVEVEQAGTKLRIEGKSTVQPQAYVEAPSTPITMTAAPSYEAPKSAAKPVEEDTTGLHIITSPIVGTFYRSPNPESPMFVNVGDRITKGKVLCIIEAMKLMNEIESDVDGVITAIYPQNGQPIEYGEKLFAVKV
jgi:acetyl-CoA carboxylase biotin carboxyl carrier protein